MKKLLLLAGAGLLMAACSESATAPTRSLKPTKAAHDDFACASGYIIAYDENGNPYCVPEDQGRP